MIPSLDRCLLAMALMSPESITMPFAAARRFDHLARKRDLSIA